MGKYNDSGSAVEDNNDGVSSNNRVEVLAVVGYDTDDQDEYIPGSAQLFVRLPDGTTRPYDAMRQIGGVAVDIQAFMIVSPGAFDSVDIPPQVA